MLPDPNAELFPIACRFVATDQWLLTHFSSSWKVAEVKKYILAKAYDEPYTPLRSVSSRHRPPSPITFALNFLDSSDEELLASQDVEEFKDSADSIESDVVKPAKSKQPSSSMPVPASNEYLPTETPLRQYQNYVLVTFSTGQVLDDDYSLSWYRLRPNELLELHPLGTIVRLPREIMLEYIQPYFESKVKALKVRWNDKDGDGDGKVRSLKKGDGRKGKEPDPGNFGDKSKKRKKTKLEWRERWLVIHQGTVKLLKDRLDPSPMYSAPVSSICALRNADDLFRGYSGPEHSPFIVCTKFRNSDQLPSIAAPEPFQESLHSPPVVAEWLNPWTGNIIQQDASEDLNTAGILSRARCASKDDGMQGQRKESCGSIIEKRKNSVMRKEDTRAAETLAIDTDVVEGTFLPDLGVEDEAPGTWLVFDLLGKSAYFNLLRIFHRHCPDTASSTSPLPLTRRSSSFEESTTKKAYYPYPEWRIEIAKRAQKAGMGDVGLAMGWIMWGNEVLSSGASKEHTRPDTQQPRQDSAGTSDPAIPLSLGEFDDDSDTSSSGSEHSELEWENWMRDLARQRRLRAQGGAGGDGATQPQAIPWTNVTSELDAVRRRFGQMEMTPVGASSASSMESLQQRSARHGAELAIPPSGSPPVGRPYSPLTQETTNVHDVLNVHTPALLTPPGVHGLPLSGVTTSTVSAGGIVRAHSLTAVNDNGRGRGVPRAMAVLHEDEGAEKSRAKKSPAHRVEELTTTVVSTTTTTTTVMQVGERERLRKLSKTKRSKTFSPERLVRRLNPAMDFMEGR